MSYATFDAIKIGIASPEMIREWSYGEVKKPETINYRTLKPERDGLFCERIFGPTKDWECHCGKYKKIRYKGKICDRCGVEVTRAKVRRERMGHIELATPVSHIWYFKGIPSRMGLLLDISPRILEKVLYFAAYIVTDPGETPLAKNQILSEKEYRDMREKYEDDFRAGMGAEAVKELLQQIDLEQLSEQLHTELKTTSGQKKARVVKRLEVVDAFRLSGNKPEWMVIDVLPVIPPEIRPMVQLDGGRFATSDLNDLYRRVINRNNRLKRLMELKAPDIIVRNEKRMLQEAVDALIDNGRRGRPVTGANNRALKSLSDMLKGKQGRFRQNLLGKRVDYSGRSVIVVGPELKIYQCGVPKEMAVELFRPFIMKKLVEDGSANNIKSAKKMVDKGRTEVWDALDEIIKDHPVMLNRAPTLHRLGIQAFEPVLVEGRALKLHPLNCTAFNADFDGDQMAIHVPLSAEAQTEARILMLSANNLLRPQDGGPVTVPTQDMVLGSYYLTFERFENGYCQMTNDEYWPEGVDFALAGKTYDELTDEERENVHLNIYRDEDEALMAYNEHVIGIHQPIWVRVTKQLNGQEVRHVVRATPGRIIFNRNIPQDLGFVKRFNEDGTPTDKFFDYEVTENCGKKLLGKIVDRTIKQYGFTIAAEVLDNIKATGYKYSTRGSITISIADMTVPKAKYELINETEHRVVDIEEQYNMGFITDEERYKLVVREWEKTTADVTDALTANMNKYNPIFMMADSGARGSMKQIRQLTGMRGLMANTAGKTIEMPIRANYREGLNVLEYFISSRGARKGLADTALRTADSGYLTRRLVDVSQDVIVREDDCGTHDGIDIYTIYDGKRKIEDIRERLLGRYLAEDFIDPQTGEVLVSKETTRLDDYAVIGEANLSDGSLTDAESNPAVKSERYVINLVTGNGQKSYASDPHKPLHVMINLAASGGYNLMWNKYEGVEVDYYTILRGPSADNLTELTQIAGSQQNYTDLDAPEGEMFYAVTFTPTAAEMLRGKAAGRTSVAVSSNVVSTSEAIAATYATSMQILSVEPEMRLTYEQGALHLFTEMQPLSATFNRVSWEIVEGDGLATIDANGLLTATGEGSGNVVVRATALDGSRLTAEATIVCEEGAGGVTELRDYNDGEWQLRVANNRGNLRLSGWNDGDEATLYIVSMQGQVMEIVRTSDPQAEIDCAGYPGGVYVVKAIAGGEAKAVKFAL